MKLKQTSLYTKQKELGAEFTSFCGWQIPKHYGNLEKEYKACKEDVALFDTSYMGMFFFEGNILFSGINNIVTIDLIQLPVGQSKYGFILDEQGKVLQIVNIYKADSDRLMFVLSASNLDSIFSSLQAQVIGGNFTNATDFTSKIDIQGPRAKQLLGNLLHVNFDGLESSHFTEADILESYGLISRTDYAGEFCYELFVDNEIVTKIWEKLLKLGATPAGMEVRELLKNEVGFTLDSSDFAKEKTPLDLNLEKFVEYSSYFVGKEVLEKIER